jgi:hypothetical protein
MQRVALSIGKVQGHLGKNVIAGTIAMLIHSENCKRKVLGLSRQTRIRQSPQSTGLREKRANSDHIFGSASTDQQSPLAVMIHR